MKKLVKCQDCFGDGIGTCHNPDRGFLIGVVSVMGANESACPCCGHDEEHKMRTYNIKSGKYENNICETCKGIGKVSKKQYDKYMDEYVSEDDIECVNKHCLSS